MATFGTSNGFIFISDEDETGISNVIIQPKVYERNQMAVTGGKFLMIEGLLQNQDSAVSVKTVDRHDYSAAKGNDPSRGVRTIAAETSVTDAGEEEPSLCS